MKGQESDTLLIELVSYFGYTKASVASSSEIIATRASYDINEGC